PSEKDFGGRVKEISKHFFFFSVLFSFLLPRDRRSWPPEFYLCCCNCYSIVIARVKLCEGTRTACKIRPSLPRINVFTPPSVCLE
ncbi:AAEL009070-PA, partial [Aedes aegypti]